MTMEIMVLHATAIATALIITLFVIYPKNKTWGGIMIFLIGILVMSYQTVELSKTTISIDHETGLTDINKTTTTTVAETGNGLIVNVFGLLTMGMGILTTWWSIKV